MSSPEPAIRSTRRPEAGETSILMLLACVGSLVVTLIVLFHVASRPEAPGASIDAGALEADVRGLRSENARLAGDLAALTRRLEVLEDASIRPVMPAPAGAPAAAADEDVEESTASGSGAGLVNEDVKATVEKTVAEAMERRDRSRLARMMGIDLDAFAEENGLTEKQRTAVSDLLGTYRDKMRDAFMSMRAAGRPASEEERAARRQQMETAMQTIRGEIVEEAATFLQPAQLASFEEQLSMPGPGGPPGGGFGRGRGR
jgi:hypothetical protein